MNGLLGDLPEFQQEMRGMQVLNQPAPQQQQQPRGDMSFLEKMAIVLAPTAYQNINNVRAARQQAQMQQEKQQSQQQRIQQAVQSSPDDFANAANMLYQQGDIEGGNKLLAIAKQQRDMRDKLEAQDLGNKKVFVNPYTGQQGAEFAVSATPGQQLTYDAAIRGQNMTAQTAANRLAFDKANAQAKAAMPPQRKPLNPTETKLFDETEQVMRSSSAVIDTLDRALEINDKAYSGIGATARAIARSQLGDDEAANATIELESLIGEQALQNLKNIFGGNPTEGERKILLDLQASTNKTPTQRAAIIKRAKEAAMKRVAASQKKLSALATGTYGTPEYLNNQSGFKIIGVE